MAFTPQELEIIKFGQQNGKSRAEVEQAISNFRNGIKPVKVAPVTEEPSLGSKLTERGKTFGRELLSIGTLGASTLTPQDVAEARQSPEQASLVGLQAFNRAFQSPIRAAGAVAGAGADILGAGLEATGIPQAIAPIVAPIAASQPVQKAVSTFKSLPEQTQEVLGDIGNVASFIPVSFGASATKTALGKIPQQSALDAIKSSSGNLTQKALDFISADPEAKVATILKESTPEQLDSFLSVAEKAAKDPRVATPFEVVGNDLSTVAKTLDAKLKEIGAQKSAVVDPLREGLSPFKSETVPLIQKLISLKNSFGEIEKGSKARVQAIINDAKTIATKKDADTFIDKVQNALYVGNIDMTIPRGSALDKQLRGIIGEYNSSLKKALPEEYSVLNQRYSEIIDTLDTINRSLGEVVEGVPVRGASLIKQFFSPSGTKAKEIFEFVKRETGVDLAKEATLAKFSMDLFDDPRSRSLLAGIGDIPTTIGGVVSKVAEKVGGEKLQSVLRESTIRKAKEISSPKSAKESYSAPKVELKSESPSSLNSTPETVKRKGIKGMIDFGEIGIAFTPSEKSIVKQALEDLKLVKSESGRMEMLKPVKELLIKERIISPTEKLNSSKIEEAAWRSLEDSDAVMAAVKKKEMSTPFVKQSEERLGSKKKVVSNEIYHGTDKKFSVFDLTKRGTNENDFPAKNAFFFTDSIETAKSYGNNIIKKQGNFEKPLTIDADGATYGDFRDELRDAIEKAQKEGNDVVIIKNLSDRKDWGNYEPTTHYAVLDMNKVSDIGVKKAVSSLEQEAKGKTLEEFINNYGQDATKIKEKTFKGGVIKAYHQTNANIDVFNKDTPVFFNSFRKGKTYGANTVEAVLDIKKPMRMGDEFTIQSEQPALIAKAKAKGYDAIVYGRDWSGNGGITEIIAVDPKIIKTKKQLTDIWESNNK